MNEVKTDPKPSVIVWPLTGAGGVIRWHLDIVLYYSTPAEELIFSGNIPWGYDTREDAESVGRDYIATRYPAETKHDPAPF